MKGIVEGLNSGADVYVVSGSSVEYWGNLNLAVKYAPAEQFVSLTHVSIQLYHRGEGRPWVGMSASKWHPLEGLGEESYLVA